MARKGENIYKRKDGRWEGRWIVSYDKTGKAKYASVYARSYTEVRKKLAERKKSGHIYRPQSKSTLSECADEWLETIKHSKKESTYAKYYSVYHKHIHPIFGDRKPSNITAESVEKLLHDKLKSGLSPRTVQGIKAIFLLLMNYAYPIFNASLANITIKQEWREMRVFSTDEQKRLCNYLKQDMDPCKLGIYICLFTGLRIGEICALQWKNINTDDMTLKVEATMQRIRNDKAREPKTKVIISPPKSQRSCRTIPLPNALVDILRKYECSSDFYVLTGNENYVEPRTLQYRFNRCLLRAGIDHANFHCTRHSFATRCIEAGMDIKSLSEILGHSSINVTMSRYVHSSMDWKRENMEKLSELL